jgi:hypothetical protein
LPKYICRIISTIKKTNIGGTQLPNRGPPHAIMYVLLDCYLRSQSSCLRWLSWYLILSFVQRCSAFIQEVQLWGGWRPWGSVCSYIVDCLGNHGVQCWRGHTIVVCSSLEDRGRLLISVLAIFSWTAVPHSLHIIVIAIPLLCINRALHRPSKWQRAGIRTRCSCCASKHLQVWFHRYCGGRCLSLCMSTVLPFCCALFACPYINTHNGIWDQKEIRLILDVWWFNNPAPVELRGPPRLKTPIPHSNPQILNTHNKNWDQNEVGLILVVWWFNNSTLVEFRDPPYLKTPFPHSNPRILRTHNKNWDQKWNWANFRCLVI